MEKIKNRSPEGIIHDSIQSRTESIPSSSSITLFENGIFPNLTKNQIVLVFFFGGTPDQFQYFIWQFVSDIQSPHC